MSPVRHMNGNACLNGIALLAGVATGWVMWRLTGSSFRWYSLVLVGMVAVMGFAWYILLAGVATSAFMRLRAWALGGKNAAVADDTVLAIGAFWPMVLVCVAPAYIFLGIKRRVS